MIIPNSLIRASAGSGKTYQLTNRFIHLLVSEVAPDRIIALTFTKKAAGEFFEGILTKLAKGASGEGEAKRLAKELAEGGCDLSPLGQAEFSTALRRLIENMPRLSLGTIDGFFHRMLGLFPFEFGLGGEFDIMSEFERKRVRMDVLEWMFDSRQLEQGIHNAIIESHRLASAGKDKRSFVSAFAKHLHDCHELYMEEPSEEYWGDPTRIWPDGHSWIIEQVDLNKLVGELEQELESHEEFNDKLYSEWGKIFAHLKDWEPGRPLYHSSKPGKLFKEAMVGLPRMADGGWEFNYNRKDYEVSDLFGCLLAKVLRHCISIELQTKLVQTKGIHSLLALFESHYDDRVRRTGRLVFSDFPILLAPSKNEPKLGGSGPSRLDIEYRLDGQFDHWLLDEFQDTSRVQWRVFENLVDEVVQDPEGQRSLFCVGDPKQSIYQWRGGDPTLFDHLKSRYHAADKERFRFRSLKKSWRSCPQVLNLVNLVFGNADTLSAYDEFGEGVRRWNAIWDTHHSAKPEEEGHALYLTARDDEHRLQLIAELLRKLRPIENDLRCAVIVQKNEVVRKVVNFLRGEMPELPVVGETVSNPGADNSLGCALLSLFRAAAHPGDGFSCGHLLLTPFGNHLSEDESKRMGELRVVQRQVYEKGFAPVALDWIGKIASDLDEFSRWRAGQFLDMARQFDESGIRDIDEFTRFIPEQELTDSAGGKAVQVMTIHKAKGLTFDATIVPDLEGNRLDEARRESLHVRKTHEGELDWILTLPNSELCSVDERLEQAINEARSDGCYENLCRLYVALTRASHGLYVITNEFKKSSKSLNYTRLLNETLAGKGESSDEEGEVSGDLTFCDGSFDWVKKRETEETSARTAIPTVKGNREHRHLARRRPSTHRVDIVPADRLFDAVFGQATSHGEDVHKGFEQIEWAGKEALAKLESLRETMPAEAVDEVEQCLVDEALAKRLAKPDSDVELWRERPFDVVLGDELISGVFDRVHLFADRAEIIDFKTEKAGEEAADRHRPQLQLYRSALAKLTGLEESVISCQLLFTHTHSLLDVD